MSVKNYRKKPVVIQALKWNVDNIVEMGQFLESVSAKLLVSKNILIETLEGDMIVSPGDYIIKGIKGEFYPCKPDIFEAIYEEV